MSKTPEKFWEDFFSDPVQQSEQESPYLTLMTTPMSVALVANKAKTEEIQCIIECSIKEFYVGSIRTVTFNRTEVEHNPKVAKCFQRSK